MNTKRYTVEVKGLGTIIADLEVLDGLTRLILDAMGESSRMVDYCRGKDGCDNTARLFEDEYNERSAMYEQLKSCMADIIEELEA